MNKRFILFATAIFIQIAILAYVPAQRIYTRSNGKSILLKIRPVDPYHPLMGYYVVLNFEIADPKEYKDSKSLKNRGRIDPIYAILQQRSDET